MQPHSTKANLLVLLTVGSLWVMPLRPAPAAPADVTAEGMIESVQANGVTIATGSGHMQVKTTPDTRVINRGAAHLEDIRVGDFIGVTGEKGAGGILTAVSINIFPADLRGRIREGQWPMESGNIMTNAVVTQYVSAVAGRTLYLKYQDGTATIIVPPGTQVHRLTLSSLGDLKPGLHVTVRGARDSEGSLTAASIVIER